MKFTITANGTDTVRDEAVHSIIEEFLHHGHTLGHTPGGANFILNITDTERPRAGRRCSQSAFIVSIVAGHDDHADIRSLCYRTLVRTLSNLLLYVRPANGSPAEVYFTTPEAGFYRVPFDPESVYRRMLPIVGAHYAIGNRVSCDLPEPYWNPSPVVGQIQHFGREMEKLGVLPLPFPLHEVLTEEDQRHLFKIYGITGLSYGNLSARESIPALGNTTFWMTGRGVNKAQLTKVGKDVLLVKGFDYREGAALVSVPPEHDPRARVSVDAVEHAAIYEEFPAVGAIVHVHAWLDDVLCTRQNYPCGTRELALEVADLLRRTTDPSRAAVGLKNHGLTITGPTLEEIFDRISGKLLTTVPMFA